MVPINRNSDQNKIVRNQYANFIDSIQNEVLIFIDDTGFNLLLTPKYGYSQKNTKCYINMPNSKGTNVSLLGAINMHGVVAFKVKKGNFKSVDFLFFIENVLPAAKINERKCILMDNPSIHKISDILRALGNRGY